MKTKIAITLGAMALSAMSGAAYAGSITQPGETIGYALGAPLPEGVYFATTGSYGSFRNLGDSADALVNIPVIAWSTPWEFFNGRIEAYVAAPEVAVGVSHLPPVIAGGTIVDRGLFINAIYNPALLVGEAWKLDSWGLPGWNYSSWIGGYAPVDNELGQDFWTFNSRTAITYNGDNWDLTAHVIYGITGDNLAGGLTHNVKTSPDYVNLDLTATKTFGKWEVGPVAYGSWDVSTISGVATGGRPYHEQGQFALGGLVGYNFTGITVQAYLTRDVWTENYFNPSSVFDCSATSLNTSGCNKAYETRFWTRLIIPLWTPPAIEPVTYKK
ncbi:MAG: transporter [Rhodomicrobium sp.]